MSNSGTEQNVLINFNSVITIVIVVLVVILILTEKSRGPQRGPEGGPEGGSRRGVQNGGSTFCLHQIKPTSCGTRALSIKYNILRAATVRSN